MLIKKIFPQKIWQFKILSVYLQKIKYMGEQSEKLQLIPSFEEYQQAKKIVIAYGNEQDRLEKIRLEEFREDLSVFFKNNDKVIINDFILIKEWNKYDIIPTQPCLEEMYDGELNDEIQVICQKHNIKASIIYWCYHK